MIGREGLNLPFSWPGRRRDHAGGDCLKRNYHTHTYRCQHARGDCVDYARVASELGMEVLGFSDHTPLPDGRWSLSKAGWNFEWTDSPESIALMIGLFLGLSAVFSVVGYLMAPVLAPAWRLTGLPAMSLRRAVDASERKVVGGRTSQNVSPEVFAAKVGDLAELFMRSG